MVHRIAPGTVSATALALVLAVAFGVGRSDAASKAPPPWALHGPYAPSVDPANFVPYVDNPFFPLEPGTAFHYAGVSGTTPQTDDMVVTHGRKRILGIECTVVRDTVSERGKPIERTYDWYAQDRTGNVWYLGENSLELKNGRFVRASDSWRSGVNGAKPGIIMLADPTAGKVYRQEYFPPGGALDQARVLGERGTVRVPYGSFHGVLVTLEWSPVEPQLEQKYYVEGVGEVQEHLVRGGHERFGLVSVTH